MASPFGLVAACEFRSTEPGPSKLWASIRIDPQGKALEAERAPLAVVLVIDTSGSMQGDPLHHVLSSCALLGDLLDARDQLAIVTFANHAGVRCGLTTVDPRGRAAITAALAGVTANGSTNMHSGISVAAGLLVTAPADLRRVMVVMSDGQPNIGLASADDLAGYVRGLKLAVSTLGFGLHHDENVLDAIATAGSGRYAYIPDPMIARVDLARAALAHGGVVADHLELRIKLEEGVELLQILPAIPLRHGGHGVVAALGDVFVDEGRLIAIELQLDRDLHTAAQRGRLAEVAVEGRAPDGAQHRVVQTLEVDLRVGAPVVDRDAQRDVVSVQADGARLAARAQADRGAHPAAASILRAMVARISALDYFVKNDGSVLAELCEQLIDEAANYERKSSDAERTHQRKASTAYKSVTASSPRPVRGVAPIAAWLVGMNHAVAGQRYELYLENSVGRGSSSDVVVASGTLSRCHARILFITDHFVIQDMGTTNGTRINGQLVRSTVLADGDDVQFGDVQFRFELGGRRP